MTDEHTLPSLPRRRTQTTNPFSHPSKRARFSSPDIFSSDPPMFSSDDDPAAENYMSRDRPKKVFRGPWYNHKKTNEDKVDGHGQRERTSLRRQFDSAVYIASDGAEDSDADFSSHVLNASNPALVTVSPRPPKRINSGPPSPEDLARSIIEARLDDNDERVDLSQLGLSILSNHTLLPLSTFIKVPSSSQTCDFTNLRPALKIFLARNSLERLPGFLFQLSGLSVLSLRSNRLVEIPAAIQRLIRLEELNLAFNSLHYLPYEILELLLDSGKLQTLTIHPNKFYEPLNNLQSIPPAPSSPRIGLYRPNILRGLYCSDTSPSKKWSVRWNVKYRCRSRVRFFSTQGSLLKGPHFPRDKALFTASSISSEQPASLAIPVATNGDIPEPPTTTYTSHARSLVEAAVRTYSLSSDLPTFAMWNNGIDVLPLSRLLHDAGVLRESEYGDRSCTICRRIFVIPRTEWLEWWEIGRKREDTASAASPLRQMENERDAIEKMIPLVRRGCSWRCVPDKVVREDM